MEIVMQRNINSLTEKVYDLVIVGGGIFGICVAWDATLRGLSVALIDKSDFAHAASSQHFKLVHGGIRYLQHADIKRTRQSSIERNVLLRLAPHLVHPLPFAIPTYGHGLRGKEALVAGLALYDLINFDRNRGITDPKSVIPPGRIISPQECLDLFPDLEKRGLTGAVLIYEAQMYNPPRLSISFLRSAVKAGTVAANYVQALEFMHDHDRIIGVKAQDVLNGDNLDIRGKVVINAAGPWASQLLNNSLGTGIISNPSFSRDAWFTVDRPLLSEEYALALQAKSKDRDALISRGFRHLFLVPWRGHTLIGVWHVVHHGGPDEYSVTERDLDEFLEEVNLAYPSLDLTLKDISIWNAGLILFGDKNSNGNSLSFGKRSLLIDHEKDYRVSGLISLIGVRYTTARGMAKKAVDLVFKKLGKQPPNSITKSTPIFGGKIECFDEYVNQHACHFPETLSREIITSLIHNYGSAYQEVLKYITEEDSWAEKLGTSNVIKAEVIHGVCEEMAQTLADIVFRRTDLGTGGYPGIDAMHTCADVMASELGWDKARVKKEIESVENTFPQL
jgi:glycerol-3-phosphate dehydrogenase